MVGSIDGVTMADVRILAVTVVPLLLALSTVAARLRIIQLGHDLASSLGVAPQQTTRIALLLAAALVAVATAIVGPIAFLAFVCGPIARRLLPANGAALTTAALVGPVVVLVADLVAQHLVPQTVQAPVGVITGVLGGCYLLWLLSTSHRAKRSR
jgi:iron complex transport system permease protein